MKQKFKCLLFILFLTVATKQEVAAQYFTEDFENITTLFANGWGSVNKSNPTGTTGWFQGDTALFPAYWHSGYIAANFDNTGNHGTISNWLISPPLLFHNGDMITFYTRTVDSSLFIGPDRLQLRLSTNGSSANVGSNEFSVGDFTNLLLDIDSGYLQQNFPIGYPFSWHKFDVQISGLTGSVQGRFAFRYFIIDGGAFGNNGNSIGIDSCSFNEGTTAIDDTGYVENMIVYPNPVSGSLQIILNKPLRKNCHIKLIDAAGKVVLNDCLESGIKNFLIQTSFLQSGNFILEITNDDLLLRKKFVKN